VVDEDHYGTDEVDAVEEVRMSSGASINGAQETEDGRAVVDFVFAREEVLRRERKRSQTVLIVYAVLSLGIVLFICGYMLNSYRNMSMDEHAD
jgi:ABC-type molybdate transport system substrate-binding protein